MVEGVASDVLLGSDCGTMTAFRRPWWKSGSPSRPPAEGTMAPRGSLRPGGPDRSHDPCQAAITAATRMKRRDERAALHG